MAFWGRFPAAAAGEQLRFLAVRFVLAVGAGAWMVAPAQAVEAVSFGTFDNFLRLQDAKGANFGWPQYEGDRVFDADRPGPHPPTFPISVYSHKRGGCAVIGGYLVRDTDLPALAGRYLYGDACTGDIRSSVPKVRTQDALADAPTGIVLPGLTSFGQGFNGRLYLAQSTGSSGTVFRMAP